jgi:type VI protein secretion system component VasK
MASKKDKKQGDGEQTVNVSISAHPRAKAGVHRARTRAALIAFMLVLVLNLVGDQTPFDAVWRALLAGIVVNVIVWRCAIVVWRHILLSELEQLEETHKERHREQQEKLEAARAEQEKRQQQADAANFRAV